MNDRDVDDADDGENRGDSIGFVAVVESAAEREIAQEQEQQQGLEHDPWIAPLPVSSPRRPPPNAPVHSAQNVNHAPIGAALTAAACASFTRQT